MRYRFADFVLDTSTRELLRDGRPVPLSPKAFRLLEVLLEARPNALPKERLHDLVWGEVHVCDESLASLVSDLRHALGDRGTKGSRLVRTVHGYGYALAAEVVEEAPRAAGTRCFLMSGDRLVPLRLGENLLGRDQVSIVPLDSLQVSRRHSRILVSDRGALLEDLGSKNGTYLEGRRITTPQWLTDGDRIGVGSVPVTFRSLPATAIPTETAVDLPLEELK